MKIYYLFVLALITSSSCSNPENVIDYRKIEWTAAMEESDSSLDSLMSADDEIQTVKDTDPISFKTSAKNYKAGEAVKLTLQNNTNVPVYLYPSQAQSKGIFRSADAGGMFPNMTQEHFEKQLICENPAMTGQIYRALPSYSSLSLFGVDDEMAGEFGYSGFKKPLQPKEKIVFTVYPPEKPGFYRFDITTFSNEKNGKSSPGENTYVFSNSFEVK